MAAGYPVARERVIRTVAALANLRSRELNETAYQAISAHEQILRGSAAGIGGPEHRATAQAEGTRA